tara:strand:+ start:344 stop:1108 length:765 start_codon:yes stop_codon:yes gene_type:complete
MKELISIAALLGATALAPAAMAQDKVLGYSVGVDLVSEYVFRGTSLGQESIQPYAEVSAGNFTAGAWFSTGVGADSELSGDEVDLYVGYSVPLEGDISLDLGATYYHYPQGGALFETENGGAGSYEVSASVGFGAVPLAPSLTAYYDFTLEAFTLEGSAGYSVPLGETVSFDLGGTIGLVEGDGFGYQWGQASAAISHAVTDSASLYIGANYVLNSDDNTLDLKEFNNAIGTARRLEATDDNMFFFGTGISTSF